MVIAWPFDQWGIDFLGLFPTTLRQLKYLIVIVEYFTKGIEAELDIISARNVWKFMWKNIVCHYGIPKVLISDNEIQFYVDSF